MKENELYIPVKNLFIENGFEVLGEVKSCDLVAVKDSTIVIVELKLYLNVELLVQANERQTRTEEVYVAVPKPKNFTIRRKQRLTFSLLNRLGIGLIFVDTKNNFAELILPANVKNNNRKKSKRKNSLLLSEINGRSVDMNKGGSNRKKIMTAYKEQALYIAYCLNINGTLKTSQLRKLGCDQKNTSNILYKNYYKWFTKEDRATYSLNEKGKKELKLYTEIIKNFEKRYTK